jgi:hypothetical protein
MLSRFVRAEMCKTDDSVQARATANDDVRLFAVGATVTVTVMVKGGVRRQSQDSRAQLGDVDAT